MNKHTIIVIAASIVIAGTIGYTVWNVIAADKIQIKPSNENTFSFFELINEEKISICNPSLFFFTFNDFKIIMVYEGRSIATVYFPGGGLDPGSSYTKQGKFTTENFEEVQYLSMHFDAMFMDTIPVRIDPLKMEVITEIQTPIIGVIPFSVTKQYSGLEFWEMMKNSNQEYSC